MPAKWVHRFATFNAGATLILLCAGALVTGTGSGLAVPDWPLSYGQFFPQMVGGVLFEHGHRLVAGTVAILTWTLCALVWIKREPKPIRLLSTAAALAVVLQAVLGGVTVLLRLPKVVSVSHACLAQIFFTLSVCLAVISSPKWERNPEPLPETNFPLHIYCILHSLGFFLQLLVGAVMRHLGAGLAIPDFPLVFGGIVPSHWNAFILVNYLHRLGALLLASGVAGLAVLVVRRYYTRFEMTLSAGLLALFVTFQGMLGATIIWLHRPVVATTVHLAVGALCLASSVVVSVLVYKRMPTLVRIPAPVLKMRTASV